MRRRRSTACAVAVTSLVTAAGRDATSAATAPIEPAKIDHAYNFASSQLAYTAGLYSATQFPATTDFTTGQWVTRSAADWRAGFLALASALGRRRRSRRW